MNKIRRYLIILLLLAVGPNLPASSVLPLSLDEQVQASAAVFRGTVLRTESFVNPADGIIYTRAAVRVEERFKGTLPPVLNVVHRSGTVGDVGFTEGFCPQFRVGEERLVCLGRRADRTLFALQGEVTATKLRRDKNAGLIRSHTELLERFRTKTSFGRIPGDDVTDQAANIDPEVVSFDPSGDPGGPSTNGLSVDGLNVPSRFVMPDRGEPIPYLVDDTFLPSGISEAQALNAVSNAMSAWAAASSFRFAFAGTQNFGTNAAAISNRDGRFRIQLHDNYRYIAGTNTLGIGGSWHGGPLLTNVNWGRGGRVAGMEFNVGLNGFVVLKHTNVAMQNLSTFTEVLTHEIGHVLGLAHSSNVETNDAVRTNSVMYYLAHADGRGAALNSYDTNVVRLLHPTNTAPWTFHRVMDITVAGTTPNYPGINELELRGYDLQTTNLTLFTNNQANLNGNFTLTGSKLKYAPGGYYFDTDRDDPDVSSGAFSYKDIIYARFSDGTNFSPYAMIRVLSFRGDDTPQQSNGQYDGIPDYWMMNYFGHGDPRSADLSRGSDDADGDRLNNLQEYIAGTNPKDPGSALRITSVSPDSLQFQARAYEVYEVLGSTNLNTWTRLATVMPTNISYEARIALPQTNITAVVSNLPNGNPRLFFRVLKVP